MPQLSLILALLACVLGGDLAPAPTDPRVFEALEGRWEGEGTLFGRPARFEMQWERVNGVAVLTFTNGMIDESGDITPVLGAVAIYRTTVAAPRGTWEPQQVFDLLALDQSLRSAEEELPHKE
jgi:hypothetical protein